MGFFLNLGSGISRAGIGIFPMAGHDSGIGVRLAQEQARATSSRRLPQSGFCFMFVSCCSIVFGRSFRWTAIARALRPCASNRNTCISRSVSRSTSAPLHWVVAGGEMNGHCFGVGGMKDLLPGQDATKGAANDGVAGVLADVAAGTGLQGAFRVAIVCVDGAYQRRCPRIQACEFANQSQAVASQQDDIHEHEMGAEAPDGIECLRSVRRRAADEEVRLGVQDPWKHAPHKRIVIQQKQAALARANGRFSRAHKVTGAHSAREPRSATAGEGA